jgi:PAS domain S-box-containing protein
VPDTNPLEQIEAIYRTAPIGLCVLDRHLRFVRVNDRLAAISGVPAAAHLGRHVREIAPEFADLAEPALRRILEGGDAVHNLEISKPPQPGSPGQTVRAHLLPLRGADGSVVGINVVAEDITERKRN